MSARLPLALLWSLAALTGCGLDRSGKDRCSDDSQCNGGRVCVAGHCQAASDGGQAGAVAPDARAPDDRPENGDLAALPDGGQGAVTISKTCGDGTEQAGEECD